jgi:transcriptional regulator PpsR
VKPFRAPTKSLGDLDAQTAASLIAAAADIAIIVDQQGIVCDVAVHSEDLARDLPGHVKWVGQPWASTLTPDSRAKVAILQRDAAARAAPKWRQLSYAVAGSPDIPVLFCAVPVSGDGRIVAFGRDLRALSVLQQRLVDAQQSMERDYSRIRNVETRYRLLFQMASDAVFIVDAATLNVTEANPTARRLLGEPGRRGAAQTLGGLFAQDGASRLQALLATVRASGRPDHVQVRLLGDGVEMLASASLFREEQSAFFLVRLSPLQTDPANEVVPKLKSKLLKLVESAPDGFVVTGTDGRIITTNAAFLEMADLTTEQQAQGESLDRWLGRPGVDLDVLIANLRQRGSLRLFATTVQGEYGVSADVEVSAVSVMNGGQPCYGFSIRNVTRRIAAEPAEGRNLPRSVEQLTELIGRVALKDLVREATDVIERLCIETALELTRDNRASAAEMLGLSRQSLYVKLRRYGLGDPATEGMG